MSTVETGYKDRNGTPIYEGSLLKWIRDEELYKSGSKKGQVKQAASEFVAGRVVKLSEQRIALGGTGGHEWWCKSLDAKESDEKYHDLPPGLNFASMLHLIEVIPENKS